MPVQRCQRGGRSGHKWGERGFCYVGPDSREKAARQGRAIQSRRMDATNAPRGLERDYRVLMTRRLRDLQGRLRTALTAATARMGGVPPGVVAPVETVAQLLASIETVRREWAAAFPSAAALDPVTVIAGRVDLFTTRQAARTVERVIPIDVGNILANAGNIRPMHERWAANNVALIGGLEDGHLAGVSKFMERALVEGKGTRSIAKVLQSRLGVSRRRANLIARNEIGTLNAEITRARMTDLGIKRFRWVDSGDDVVRPLHQEINGQIFDYPNGHPTEGLPGEPINCRCTAEPVLS